MNADRIAQAYFGNPLHPSTERCRRRIHWMCAQATGSRVLDIGCSQGIVCLILAREGFHCTGVDLERDALEWAEREAAREPPLVRERLRFEAADATALPFADNSFDTVYLGEVIEHLAQPIRVLQEVRRVLTDGGRVVITVPLGLNHGHADHKHVFYPTSLVRMVRPFFRALSVTELDGYVAYAGINNRHEAADAISAIGGDDWLVRELESYCLRIESDRQRIRGHLKSMRRSLDDTRTRLATLESETRERPTLQAQIATLEGALDQRGQLLNEAEAASRRLADDLRKQQLAAKALEAALASTREELKEASQRQMGERADAVAAAIERARRETAEATRARVRHQMQADEQADVLRRLVRSVVPEGEQVLVVSKGDERLTHLDGRIGLHFPQGADGGYAGFHPPDGAWAVAHLRSLQTAGARYFLLPSTASWWLSHYAELALYLAAEAHPVAFKKDAGVLFALQPRPAASAEIPVHVAMQPTAAVAAPSPKVAATTTGRAAATVSSSMASTEVPSLVSVSAMAGASRPRGDDFTLGVVLDAFTSSCLAPEARLVSFRPDNWRQTLEQHAPDALFVESAWDGNDGAWKYRVARYEINKGDELVDLVQWAKRRDIPTVFWNKEDPVHFDRFVDRAQNFEHVATTDANCVERYRSRLGHDRVYDLPFAAQPRLHNPIQLEPRSGTVCFAGSYYGDRHDARRRDVEHVLRPALDFGLDIYDRRFGMNGSDQASYAFPQIYASAIRGRLGYADMVKAYKRYRVFLNVNSVKDSPTMCSRRVFELLACGTPVISSPARGVTSLLGDDVVAMAETEAETRRHLERLLSDEDVWARTSLRGLRCVLEAHTYAQRLDALWDRIGLRRSALPPIQLGVLARVAGEATARALADAMAAQHHRPASVVLAGETPLSEATIDYWRNRLDGVAVRYLEGANGRTAEQLSAAVSSDWVAFVDDRDHYAPNYLRDFALATQYSDCDLMGKQSFARRSAANDITRVGMGSDFRKSWSVASGSLVASRGAVTPELVQEWLRARTFCRPSGDILSIDRFNYVQDAHPEGRLDLPDPGLLHAVEA